MAKIYFSSSSSIFSRWSNKFLRAKTGTFSAKGKALIMSSMVGSYADIRLDYNNEQIYKDALLISQ